MRLSQRLFSHLSTRAGGQLSPQLQTESFALHSTCPSLHASSRQSSSAGTTTCIPCPVESSCSSTESPGTGSDSFHHRQGPRMSTHLSASPAHLRPCPPPARPDTTGSRTRRGKERVRGYGERESGRRWADEGMNEQRVSEFLPQALGPPPKFRVWE